MQKFTVFSILLSLSIVLGTVDVFFHGYLTSEEESPPVDTSVDTQVDTSFEETVVEEEVTSDETSPEETLVEEAPTEEVPPSEETVELQEESPESWLSEAVFTDAGFTAPTLKSALFSGLVFQFLPVGGSEDDSLQWNLFDGQNYIGTIYELSYLTDTGSFSSYLALRDEAGKLTGIGAVNEVNMYGDASFYFNHKTKVKTVHMVVRYGNRVYGFEYATTAHEKMKKVFDILKTLQ